MIIKKLIPTSRIHIAWGKVFHMQLSNGEWNEVYSEQLLEMFCIKEDQSLDEDLADRYVENDFQDLIGKDYI